jgi:hypothetical protein
LKKTALGVVLALMLAAIPVSLFATSAAADSNSDVHIIFIDTAFAPNIFVDNTLIGHQVPTATAFDVTLGTGSHTVVACDNTATRTDGTLCFNGPAATDTVPGVFVGAPNNVNIGSGGANYTVVLNAFGVLDPPGATFTFQNNLNTTGFNRARFQLNNATAGAGIATDLDVCIDSHDGNGLVPILTDVAAETSIDPVTGVATGGSDSNEITAVQGAQVYIGPNGSPCNGFKNFTLNFPAGTNTVFTATDSGDDFGEVACATACVQVLFVGEDTHPNNPDTDVFCANIANLVGVQAGLKDLVGDVDPTNKTTIANTQPSAGDMQSFIETTNGTLILGDESVPAIVAAQWATATAGLRKLIHTFQLVGYDLSKLPPAAVEQIVLGANGIQLPGVPEDTDVVGATEALTAFYTSVCAPVTPTTPTTPTTPAATPVAAAARFTG